MSDLKTYLNEIGRTPMLTAAEEIDLGRKIARMNKAEQVPETERSKADHRAIKIGLRARNRMVQANLRFVVSLARKFNFGHHLELMDLIQEGSIGLHRAAEKYDPERGYKFSTYAYWWIRQAISRSLATHDRVIRLPCSAGDVIRKVQAFVATYQEQYGKRPSLQECAEHARVTTEALEHYLFHAGGVRSFDAAIAGNSEDDHKGLDEVIAAETPDPLHELELSLDIEHFHVALDKLDRQGRDIVLRYYGLEGYAQANLQEISNETGVSRERIRQIKEKALRRLRVHMNAISQ